MFTHSDCPYGVSIAESKGEEEGEGGVTMTTTLSVSLREVWHGEIIHVTHFKPRP